jgi:hypothetical protein
MNGEGPANRAPHTVTIPSDKAHRTRSVGRFCSAAVYRRRRVAHLLDDVLRELHPPKVTPPGTFGLDRDDLGRHVDTLLAAGWSWGEIAIVIDFDGIEAGR